MSKKTYRIEITDTFGGEANYCWVNRYEVKASSIRGAANALSRHEGGSWRFDYDDGTFARYNRVGDCVCAFIEEVTE